METDLASTGASAEPGGSFLRRHGVKLAVSLFLAVIIAWVLARGGLPIIPERSAFAHYRLWTLPIYVGLLVVTHLVRAVRWRHLLRPLGHVPLRNIVGVSWIAFAAILLAPLRSGEFVRPYLLTKRSRIRLLEATGTIGAERVIEGLVLSIFLFVGLQLSTQLSPLPDHVGNLPVPAAAVPRAAYSMVALFMCAFATMGVFFFARDFARKVTHAVVGIVSNRLADVLSDAVERLAAGLRFLPSLSHSLPFLAETVLYWALGATGTWFLAWSCGLDGITYAQAVVTMGCIGMGVLIPSGPGFFGVFQLSTYMALAMFFPESVVIGPGSAFVFLLYGFNLVWSVVAAGIGYALNTPVPESEGGPAIAQS